MDAIVAASKNPFLGQERQNFPEFQQVFATPKHNMEEYYWSIDQLAVLNPVAIATSPASLAVTNPECPSDYDDDNGVDELSLVDLSTPLSGMMSISSPSYVSPMWQPQRLFCEGDEEQVEVESDDDSDNEHDYHHNLSTNYGASLSYTYIGSIVSPTAPPTYASLFPSLLSQSPSHPPPYEYLNFGLGDMIPTPP